MKNRLSFLALCILLLPFLPSVARASETTHYSWLARKAGDLSSAKVMQMADRYAANGRHGEALVLYALVYDRFSEDMDDDGKNMCSLARQKAGKVYYDRGDYVEALDEFINGVKLSEQCDKPRYAARIYNHIGNVYCIFLDWEKGLDYYHKAYDLVEKYRDRKTEHDILVNMTGIYTFLEDMPEARKYYRLSERTKDTSDPEDVYMSGFTHSLIRICEGDAMKAIACLKSLAVYAQKKKLDPKYQCFAYQEIYGAYGMAGMPDSTLKYMILCDAVAHRYNLQHTFATTLKSLSEFYEDRGDAVMSNKYKSLYMDIMDSIYNMRRFDAAKNSLFTYEVSKTTREISDLKERENQRLQTIRMQRTGMAAVAVVAIVTAVFLTIVWAQKHRLRRSYADLYTVNRNFIDTQEQLTVRLRTANEALKAANEELAAVKSYEEKMGGFNGGHTKKQPKYQSSCLAGEQARMLADAIRNVMEDTTMYCNCNFSLGMLADAVGSNSKYVSQVINDIFHKTFNDYVNPYRIHLACARFADTEHYGHLTMKAVAESVGFKSYSSFVSVFRKVTGISPSLYQSMALKEKSSVNA